MQSFFEQATRFEMRLTPSWHVDDLASARIAGGGLGSGIFDLKNSEATDLNAITFNETIAHGGKKTVNHLSGEIFFAVGMITDEEGQFFFGDRRQALFLHGRQGGAKGLKGVSSFFPYLLGIMMLGKVLRTSETVKKKLDNPNGPNKYQKIAPRAPLFS